MFQQIFSLTLPRARHVDFIIYFAVDFTPHAVVANGFVFYFIVLSFRENFTTLGLIHARFHFEFAIVLMDLQLIVFEVCGTTVALV